MKILIIILIICSLTPLMAIEDSLLVTHFALQLSVKSYEPEILKIFDNNNVYHFQGLYNANTDFVQTLVLPLDTDSLFVVLGDSLQAYDIQPKMNKVVADFTPPPPTWMQKMLMLKHDLEKVFPILALVIIFAIKKNMDRKKDTELEDYNAKN